jgi:hypothetical protein
MMLFITTAVKTSNPTFKYLDWKAIALRGGWVMNDNLERFWKEPAVA